MIDLPEKFLERMKADLGESFAPFLKSYDRSPYKAIRVNTLKISPEEFKKISPFALSPVPWEKNGFYVNEEKAGKTLLHAAGLYYVQEPSAMSAAPKLEVKAGERVLDMCSAPGGKGTQLAQQMCGEGVIVMNEVNFSRAKILSQNVERLGITNAAVISDDPERIAAHFEGYFDKVLVDAPCSGEGMFLKEESAVREWSEENVSACAKRQSLILDSAQKALKPNGLLVYSTCTFAPEEDERQVENFLKKYPDFRLLSMDKLLPHEVAGEGHFVALLKKTDGKEGEVSPFRLTPPDRNTLKELQELNAIYPNLHVAGDAVYSIMQGCPSLPFKTLRAGLRLCEVKGARTGCVLTPCHSWAMSLNAQNAPAIELTERDALSYLKGNVIPAPVLPRGWYIASYLGYALGWCKVVDGVAKNHLPKGLRI